MLLAASAAKAASAHRRRFRGVFAPPPGGILRYLERVRTEHDGGGVFDGRIHAPRSGEAPTVEVESGLRSTSGTMDFIAPVSFKRQLVRAPCGCRHQLSAAGLWAEDPGAFERNTRGYPSDWQTAQQTIGQLFRCEVREVPLGDDASEGWPRPPATRAQQRPGCRRRPSRRARSAGDSARRR